MSYFSVDLTTEDGRQAALSAASKAAAITAILTLISGAIEFAMYHDIYLANDNALIQMLVLTARLSILSFISAWRFRQGKGLFWGGALTLFLFGDMLSRLLDISYWIGLALRIPLLIIIFSGVRAAHRLHKNAAADDVSMFK